MIATRSLGQRSGEQDRILSGHVIYRPCALGLGRVLGTPDDAEDRQCECVYTAVSNWSIPFLPGLLYFALHWAS